MEVLEAPELTPAVLRRAKRHGFSDVQIGLLRDLSPAVVRGVRHALGIRPVFKTVDTCAAEFAARTPYHYSSYDEETEVRPRDEGGGDHPRLRAEPDRPGHRVRLLVRARQPRAVGGRLRDDHGQLQPRDGLHRLRHLGPALLRAAHARGRARDRARGAGGRPAGGGDLPARRPDPARARPGPGGRRRADRRHHARGDPPRRGARRVRPGARRGGAARPEARDGHVVRRGARDRGGDHLPGAGPAVLRARRARHGDRVRRRRAARLHRPARPRSARSTRCWSTGSSTTRSRSTSTRSTTARSCSSAA